MELFFCGLLLLGGHWEWYGRGWVMELEMLYFLNFIMVISVIDIDIDIDIGKGVLFWFL